MCLAAITFSWTGSDRSSLEGGIDFQISVESGPPWDNGGHLQDGMPVQEDPTLMIRVNDLEPSKALAFVCSILLDQCQSKSQQMFADTDKSIILTDVLVLL